MQEINIVLKHFAKRFTNEYLSLLRELYTYLTGKTDEGCRLYVRDIVLLGQDFVSTMKWRKGKVIKLIRGIDNKVRGAKLLVYNKNKEKILQTTFTVNCTSDCTNGACKFWKDVNIIMHGKTIIL